MCPISPLDDRYREDIREIENIFSEFSLVKYRLLVEIEYVILLSKFLSDKDIDLAKEKIRKIYQKFSLEDFRKIKSIEKRTKHDVKAIEYFLREEFHKNKLDTYAKYIHLGLTSEDVNNIAYSIILRTFLQKYLFLLNQVIKKIINLGVRWRDVVILSRTHGQPAVPTTIGKEFMIFAYRLCKVYSDLINYRFPGKLNGAVGNYNALSFIFPQIDWIEFSKKFIKNFDLEPILITTQRNIHDTISDFLRKIVSVNYILLNFVTDVWLYIMLGYFKLKFKDGQVGSSTMPHKVNPIYFENAEGNLTISNALLESIAGKLQVSRLQRDLSDSTIKRNYGLAIGHSFLALKNIFKGLEMIDIDYENIEEDLSKHWEVLAEAIQVFLRVHGYEDAYEKIKPYFQGKTINKEKFVEIIKNLRIPDNLKKELLKLDVHNYIGLALSIVNIAKKYCFEKI
ncbi:MAG: adenylosuccinate lyase [Thermoproteales archaeon]|nr:adenylosuccinate lyase [Thermoproteales archaeon]